MSRKMKIALVFLVLLCYIASLKVVWMMASANEVVVEEVGKKETFYVEKKQLNDFLITYRKEYKVGEYWTHQKKRPSVHKAIRFFELDEERLGDVCMIRGKANFTSCSTVANPLAYLTLDEDRDLFALEMNAYRNYQASVPLKPVEELKKQALDFLNLLQIPPETPVAGIEYRIQDAETYNDSDNILRYGIPITKDGVYCGRVAVCIAFDTGKILKYHHKKAGDTPLSDIYSPVEFL